MTSPINGEVESTLVLATCSPGSFRSALFFGLWTFIARRMAQGSAAGGLMSIGKSKAKIYVESDTGVRFDDVAGVDEAKDELREIVDFPEGPGTVRPPRRAHAERRARWSARPAPARRCSPRPSPVRPKCRSSRSRDPSSLKCSSASAPRGCATCSSRRAPRRRPSSSSTSSTRWAAPAASALCWWPRREGADA